MNLPGSLHVNAQLDETNAVFAAESEVPSFHHPSAGADADRLSETDRIEIGLTRRH